jgi:hypothetical protein
MPSRAKWRLRKRLPHGLSCNDHRHWQSVCLRAVVEGVKQIGELAAELRKVEQALAEFSAFAEQRAKHTSDFSGDFFSSLLKVRAAAIENPPYYESWK